MRQGEKIIMETAIFTDIVENIAIAGNDCELDKEQIIKVDKTFGTDTMKKLSELMDEEYISSIAFKEHVSLSLPYALGTLRDSMILQDKYASEAIETNVVGEN